MESEKNKTSGKHQILEIEIEHNSDPNEFRIHQNETAQSREISIMEGGTNSPPTLPINATAEDQQVANIREQMELLPKLADDTQELINQYYNGLNNPILNLTPPEKRSL